MAEPRPAPAASRRGRSRRILVPAVSLAVATGVAVGCATNPVSGEREFTLLGEGQAARMGAEADQQIVAQFGLLEDPELQAYVEGIGQQLVARSHTPEEKYTFRVLDDATVNAFALPGGYIYVTRGILAYLFSEAALAGVLGHEIGHVAARHSAQRYTQGQLVGLGVGVGSIFAPGLSQIAGAGAQLMLLKYSRDDERESDELGVMYATALGYETEDMARFFATLQELNPQEGQLPSFLSTHPDPGERTGTILALTQGHQQPGREYTSDRGDYLRHLDGLVFGQDPRQGYVQGARFLHPELAFEFPVPDGWEVVNSTQQVQLVAPDQAAALIFMPAAGSSPSAAAQAFVQQEGVQVQQQGAVRINGQEGIQLLSVAQTEGGQVAVLSTFFPHGGRVFAFHGLAGADRIGAYQQVFTAVPQGFSTLTDAQAMAVQPIRIVIIEATRSAPFSQQVAGHPIPPGAGIDLTGLALLNGVRPDTPIHAGTPLKVLQGGGQAK